MNHQQNGSSSRMNGSSCHPSSVSTSVSSDTDEGTPVGFFRKDENEHDDDTKQPATNEPVLHWTDFTRTRPWILVPNGSWAGFFDNVPKAWRVGPWSTSATCYLAALLYLTAVSWVYYCYSDQDLSLTEQSSEQPLLWYKDAALLDDLRDHYRSDYQSPQFYYNASIGLWMLLILYLLPWRALGTYTVQSWTLLLLRHVLCAVLSWSLQPTSSDDAQPRPSDDWTHRLLIAVELLRFPVACSPTLTFSVWNSVIMPFIYYSMKTAERRSGFIKFCFSFKMVQIHVFNMIFCVAHVAWASPPRLLQGVDLLVAVSSMLTYMLFYLFVLDRVGVHLYPIFSPRIGFFMVLVSWTLLLGAYVLVFVQWREYLRPMEDGGGGVDEKSLEDLVERHLFSSRISQGIL